MAAYPNNYQAAYQPMYYQSYQQPAYQNQQMQQPAQTNSNLIWVQGEAGAKSYLVAPNNTVQLWDSERNTIYLKSADASGMPSMRILDYTFRESQPVNTAVPVAANNSPAYATKQDVDALYSQISALRAEIDGLTAKKAPPKAKKEAEDE